MAESDAQPNEVEDTPKPNLTGEEEFTDEEIEIPLEEGEELSAEEAP